MLQAAIFDMDGLMLDTEPIWAESWPISFGRRGLKVVPGLAQRCVGGSFEHSAALVAEAYNGDPVAQLAFSEHYDVAIEQLVESGAPKKPGIDELLAWLSEKDVPCAVASSSNRRVVEACLRHAGLDGYFSVVVTGDDGNPSKPAPDIFLDAARRLGADPARTLVLEDSPAGVAAGSAGGFVTVMVPDTVPAGEEQRRACARVCETLLEVRDLLAAGELG